MPKSLPASYRSASRIRSLKQAQSCRYPKTNISKYYSLSYDRPAFRPTNIPALKSICASQAGLTPLATMIKTGGPAPVFLPKRPVCSFFNFCSNKPFFFLVFFFLCPTLGEVRFSFLFCQLLGERLFWPRGVFPRLFPAENFF